MKARPRLWLGMFFFNCVAITSAQIFELIEAPAAMILFVINMALLVPAAKAMLAKQEAAGAMSSAIRTYNRRMLICGMIYMVAMIGAGNLSHKVAEGSPLLWLMALTPLLPIFGMIWAMYRYLKEESDEFLRYQAITRALVGLALVLALSTAWGFLEMFGLVPHIWLWAVFPVWAAGMGAGMCFTRSSGDEQ